eukprot:11841392-Ditylum_brightwellii.AAC.1
MAKEVPESTHEERMRFLKARKDNVEKATQQLRDYMEWRKELDLDQIYQQQMAEKRKEEEEEGRNNGEDVNSNEEIHEIVSTKDGARKLDEQDWIMASKTAMAYDGSSTSSSASSPTSSLPQLVFLHKSSTNTKILHVLPARLDLKLASPQTYSLSIAIYLDKQLNRSSTEKADVVVDLRGGYGWSNPRPTAAFPFIKSVSSLLERHFPERLDR